MLFVVVVVVVVPGMLSVYDMKDDRLAEV